MRYFALATDYDGTLASAGTVNEATLKALKRLKASGRTLLLVTGRELDDLLRVFPHTDMFDMVVAENGALLYRPSTREQKVLSDPPPKEFIDLLRKQGVDRMSVGRVIVATREPFETTVLDAIRELGLELQVVFNKGAVMVLPSGVNKATGLKEAIAAFSFSPHNIVGIGDAENDHAFLTVCECAVAVDNALPMLKRHADFVTHASHGEGVTELIDMILDNDLKDIDTTLRRHDLLLGTRVDGKQVWLPPYGVSVLLAGTSGSGKSTFAAAFMERLCEQGYQFCIIDPEGDYQNFESAVVLGDVKSAPTVEMVTKLLENPDQNGVVNLLGIPLEHRPAFFGKLLPALLEMRARTGRPHWLIIDETHHLLPTTWNPAEVMVKGKIDGLMMITVHPDRVSRVILSSVDAIVAIGAEPGKTITRFSETLGQQAPSVPAGDLETGEAIAWWRRPASDPFWFRSIPPKTERRRHRRKYAEGELAPERSFYFRGPEGKLNLRAQNLHVFLQMAEGVDDDTWMHHLRHGDYSTWFREKIKDADLADAAARIERREKATPKESREQIRQEIEERYTATE